jgi:hypothetical protein
MSLYTTFVRLRTRSPRVLTISVVAVLVVLGGGIWFFRGYSKQQIARQAFEYLAQTSSYHARGELQLKLPPLPESRERPFTEVLVGLEGDVVMGEEVEFVGSLYGETRGRGTILFTDGELRLLADTVAFRLENLPVLLNPTGTLVKKWTYVDAPVLRTHNVEDIHREFLTVVARAQYTGKEVRDERSLYHFTIPVSVEQEEQLLNVLSFEKSGSQAWHVLARLLRGADLHSFDIWVDKEDRTISFIEMSFVMPLEEGTAQHEFALLSVALSDYGKSVNVERPERQLAVRPDVFAHLFGNGDLD